MGIFNLFNKEKKENRIVDHMNDEQLKEKIKNTSIEMIKKEHEEIDVNSKIEICFKYLENVEHKGVQSLYLIKIDNETFYFSISNDSIQLLDDSAKSFFDSDEEE